MRFFDLKQKIESVSILKKKHLNEIHLGIILYMLFLKMLIVWIEKPENLFCIKKVVY